MRRADGDEDAGFADLQATQAMGDGDTIDGEFVVDGGGDFADFGEGHGFVGFVVEIQRAAAVGLVADATVEGNDGAIVRGADVADQGGGVDGLADEQEKIVGGCGCGLGRGGHDA